MDEWERWKIVIVDREELLVWSLTCCRLKRLNRRTWKCSVSSRAATICRFYERVNYFNNRWVIESKNVPILRFHLLRCEYFLGGFSILCDTKLNLLDKRGCHFSGNTDHDQHVKGLGGRAQRRSQLTLFISLLSRFNLMHFHLHLRWIYSSVLKWKTTPYPACSS